MSDLALYLTKLRAKKKMTLREVEAVTGISNPYISQVETGKVKKPSFENVCILCRCYDASVLEASKHVSYSNYQELNVPNEEVKP